MPKYELKDGNIPTGIIHYSSPTTNDFLQWKHQGMLKFMGYNAGTLFYMNPCPTKPKFPAPSQVYIVLVKLLVDMTMCPHLIFQLLLFESI